MVMQGNLYYFWSKNQKRKGDHIGEHVEINKFWRHTQRAVGAAIYGGSALVSKPSRVLDAFHFFCILAA